VLQVRPSEWLHAPVHDEHHSPSRPCRMTGPLRPRRELNLPLRRLRRWVSRVPRPTLTAAIESFARRCELDSGSTLGDGPIFIFGASWRCGSTWLQRIVMSSGRVLVWGEPFDRSCIVQTMANQLLPITKDWPWDWAFLDKEDTRMLPDRWVGNLYPSCDRLLEAHREYFRTLFALPAQELGLARWGLKEIRLTTAHARYLRLLFPDSKFLFLVRNPFDAYRSYRERGPWWDRWPDRLVATARGFGRMWVRLAADFLDHHAGVNGLLLKYEDLVSDAGTMRAVAEYLDLPLEPARAARRLTAIEECKTPSALPTSERRRLQKEVHKVARRLAYA
jgi:Sulfotransferase family